MRYLISLFVFLTSMHLRAEEMVVLQFTISSETISGQAKEHSVYTNGVLLGLNDFSENDFDKRYNLKFRTTSTDKKKLSVVLTIGKYFSEKLYYIGDKSLEIPIGETRTFELVSKKENYKVTLSSFYGESDLVAK